MGARDDAGIAAALAAYVDLPSDGSAECDAALMAAESALFAAIESYAARIAGGSVVRVRADMSMADRQAVLEQLQTLTTAHCAVIADDT